MNESPAIDKLRTLASLLKARGKDDKTYIVYWLQHESQSGAFRAVMTKINPTWNDFVRAGEGAEEELLPCIQTNMPGEWYIHYAIMTDAEAKDYAEKAGIEAERAFVWEAKPDGPNH